MPIFGQVWLWSSLAFLLGALLCWGLVALPARRRVGELEAELTARARRQPQNEPRRSPEDERADFDARRLLAGTEREPERHEGENGPLTRAYALTGTRTGSVSAPPEIDTELSDGPRTSATQYLNVSGQSSLAAPPEVPPGKDLGWFDDKKRREEQDSPAATTVLPQVPAGPVDARLVEDVPASGPVGSPVDDRRDDDDGGTVFSQRTHPIPGELIRQLDDTQQPEPAHALVDGPGDGIEDTDERGILAELDASGESKHQLVEDPEVTSVLAPTAEPSGAGSDHGVRDRTEVVPAHTAQARDEPKDEAVSASRRHGAAGDHSTSGTEEPKNMPGVNVYAEPTKNKLPKRVPSKPPSRTPFGVQTTSPASPEPAAATTTATESVPAESANEAPRALFEPIVPAGDGQQPPPTPPHKVRGAGNGRGPFGPGSAMPGPGGRAPSPDYTIKASASAMRYCTQESDSYERTVAEVWFRSVADAERVGFKPLG